MSQRLPKKFWRVNVTNRAGKLRLYDRKSKTYAQEASARESLDNFRSRGIECELWESDPVTWKLVDSKPMEGEQQLW